VIDGDPMLLSELIGKQLRDEDGRALGRVVEVRTKDSRVEALICGRWGLLQRLANFRTGSRVAWSQVRRIEGDTIICACDKQSARRGSRAARSPKQRS
jgi:sporulation protein YlmC with PRC-barrel domain